MKSSIELNSNVDDITNQVNKRSINLELLIKESNRIIEILSILCSTKFDDNFSITNSSIYYKLGNDSKIISKIYEIVLIEKLKGLLHSEGFEYIENDIQNKYPDFIIISKIHEENYYAIDIKSTYLKTTTKINGFTLGTYKGYFRNRNCMNSIVRPYKNFNKHFCVCVIYDRHQGFIPVKHIIVREKWEIASHSPGSGNTCNIGSIKLLTDLIDKKYYFDNEDANIKYWLNYKC